MEFSAGAWVSVLEDNRIAVLPIDSEHVRLCTDDHSTVFRVLNIPRLVRAHDITAVPERHALLIGRGITDDALERAWAAGWSVTTDSGHTSDTATSCSAGGRWRPRRYS